MADSIRVSTRKGEEDGRTGPLRELQRPESSRRGPTEKADLEPLLAPRVLIQEGQDVAPGIQGAHETNARPASHRNLFQRGARFHGRGWCRARPICSSPHPADRPLERGLTETPINRRDGQTLLSQSRGPQLPVAQVRSDQNHPLPTRFTLSLLEMLEPLDPHPVDQDLSVPAGQKDQFGETAPQMREYLARPGLTRPSIPLWKSRCELLSNATNPRQA